MPLSHLQLVPTAPHRHRALRNGTGDGTATVLEFERLLLRTSEHRDVLAGEGVDPFEGLAPGIEVPEVSGHGDEEGV